MKQICYEGEIDQDKENDLIVEIRRCTWCQRVALNLLRMSEVNADITVVSRTISDFN